MVLTFRQVMQAVENLFVEFFEHLFRRYFAYKFLGNLSLADFSCFT